MVGIQLESQHSEGRGKRILSWHSFGCIVNSRAESLCLSLSPSLPWHRHVCERVLLCLCDVCVEARKGCLVFCSSTLQIIPLIFSLNPLKLSASKQAPGILSDLHSPGIIDNVAIPAFIQCQEFELRSSRLQSKHSHSLSHLPSPLVYFPNIIVY